MQKISFKMVNSSLTQEQTKTVNSIEVLLSRCQNETKKIFETSAQKRSCHWISSLRQCQNILELCLGELCGMLASTGFASVGDTINLLQFVQKTNFEYLLKGYMLLFKRWESNAETNVEVQPQKYKESMGIKHFAKDELKTVNSLQFYKQQKELGKKRPKILLKSSKTVANLGVFNEKESPLIQEQGQAQHINQEDSDENSDGDEGDNTTKIKNSIESGFMLLQKIRQEDQEFIKHVEAVLNNKKKAVPESKMPLVINNLDEVLQTIGDANEDLELMDETVLQQHQKSQRLILESSIKSRETAEFQLDISPIERKLNDNDHDLGVNLIREEDENIEVSGRHKLIMKLQDDIRSKNETILDLKASLKEKEALIKEIELQNKHYIFLSTQLKIDLKGLKMVFDEESDKLVQERQKKNDAEAKLAVIEQTIAPNNNDNIRLILEKMVLEAENNHLNERISVMENEIGTKLRKVTKVVKGKLVREGKESKLVPQSLTKEKSARGSSIENYEIKGDLQTLRTRSNDPPSVLSKEYDQPDEQLREIDQLLMPNQFPQARQSYQAHQAQQQVQQAHQQEIVTQSTELKLSQSVADLSQPEVIISKNIQARNSLVDFKNIMQNQEEEDARIEQARKVTEENLKRTLIKGFVQKSTVKQRDRSVESRRPQVLTSREKGKYMLHRNASYGAIAIDDNFTGNFTERDNSKSRELPQINFSTTAGNDDSIQMQRAADTKAMLDTLLPTVDRKEKALIDKNYWGMVIRDPLRKNYKALRSQPSDMYDTQLRPLDYSELSSYPTSQMAKWDKELSVQSFSKMHGQGIAKWQLTEEDEVEMQVNPGGDAGKMVIVDLGHQREKEVRDLYECLNQNAENVQVFILWIKEIARVKHGEDGDHVLTRLEAEVEFIQSLKTFGQFREFYIKCIESHKDCGKDCAHVIKFRERIKVMTSNKIKIKPKDKDKEKKKKKGYK